MSLNKPHVELREWCTLVGEECEWDNCDGCPNNMPTLTQHEENLKDCEFHKLHMIDGSIPCTINRSNTIAKTHMCKEVKDYIKKYGLKKMGYMPANMKQYPLFFMLKKTLGLNVPHEIYAKKDNVCVVMYGDIIYLFAPRIESE